MTRANRVTRVDGMDTLTCIGRAWRSRTPCRRVRGAFLGALATVLLTPLVTTAQLGTVGNQQKISEIAGGFGGSLNARDLFGGAAASLGDMDGDGIGELAVGAYYDDDGSVDQGAVWILFLAADGTVRSQQKISETSGGFQGALDTNDNFGYALAALGDLDGDGIGDLAVGAHADDDGGSGKGAVWILFLDSDGTVKSEQKISETAGSFGGALAIEDQFGASLAVLGDLDGDGITELAVGEEYDDDGGSNQGALWILFLDNDGTVKSEQKISETAGGFGGFLDNDDFFARALATLGDLDGDGVTDLAVGAPTDDDGDSDQGAVWILFLETNGSVKSEQKISETTGGFGGALDHSDFFGLGLASLGDLDGDGITDLAVAANADDDGGLNQGAVWILFLNTDGTVKSQRKISETEGSFDGVLDVDDRLGYSLAALGDLDGDGVGELVVGALNDDDGGTDQGAAWILFLRADTIPPTIACPPIVSVVDAKGGMPGSIAYFSVTVSDDSDPAPSVTCMPASGSFFPRGTTIVTCTATDVSGNQSVCLFPVVVWPTVREQEL